MFVTITEPHVRRLGRSDAAPHPRTSRGRRPLRDGSGATLSDVAARRFKTLARFGKRRTRPPQTRRAPASFEIGSQADAAGAVVDRGIPEILGRKFRPFGRLFETTTKQEKKKKKKKTQKPQSKKKTSNFNSPASSTLRAIWFSRRGRTRTNSSIGSARRRAAGRRCYPWRWTRASAANIEFRCGAPTASTSRPSGFIAK